MKSIYINEPLRQKLPAFYEFMGGLNGLIKNSQELNKLFTQPRHWRGTNIPVTKKDYWDDHDVQTTVYEDNEIVYCNHANKELETVIFYGGMDDEYSRELFICQKCGAGWDENGEQLIG